MVDNRAQAVSIESLFAAFIIITSLTFAFNVLIINENSLGFETDSYAQVENSSATTSLLESSSEQDMIKPTLLYWDTSSSEFYDTTSEDYYTEKLPPTELGNSLSATIRSDTENININLEYWEDTDNDGQLEKTSQQLVNQGDPDITATSSQYTILIQDTDVLYNEDGSESETTVSEASFYAPDSSPSEVYNLITIEVIIWQE